MPDSFLQWPLSQVLTGISASSLSLVAVVHGSANHLFIQLHNSGHPGGAAIAKASALRPPPVPPVLTLSETAPHALGSSNPPSCLQSEGDGMG